MSSQLQVSGEAKIRDIQGPVVANSGVITALDGAASQYVRGDGTLADFPTSSGGGSSVSYYLNSSVSQGTIGGVAYRELSKEPIIGAGTDIAISANGYVASYITDVNDPDVILIPGGNFNCEFYFSVNNETGNPTTYAELYKYDGTTFTLLGSSVGVPESINQGTVINPYYFAIPVATATLALTDRLAIRIYVNVDGRTVTLHTENGHLCQVVTTLSKGMVSLNNLTDQSQFITTGTTGTNFNIVSTGDTHTFNLPVASATNTGKLSSTDWSTFNNKLSTASAAATYVPYTGATTNVNLGAYSLTANQLIAGGASTDNVATLTTYDQGHALKLKGSTGDLFFVPYFSPSIGARITAQNSAASANTPLSFYASNFYFNSNVNFGSTLGNGTYTYTLPSATGTLALTSNLSAYLPLTGGTLTGALAGTTANFSGSIITNVTFAAFNGGSLEIYNTGTTNYFDLKSTGGNFQLRTNVGVSAVNALTIASTGAATFSSSVAANGVMSLGNDGTYGSNYKTLGLTGNTDGTHRIFGGTSDDLYIASATSRNIQFWTNGVTSTRMIITTSGNVGIGTSSPSYFLDVLSSSVSTARFKDSSRFCLVTIESSGTNQSTYLEFKPTGTGSAIFQVNGTDRMAITSGGNVGIGTSSPTANLQISGLSGLPATSGSAQRGALRIANSSNIAFDFGTVAAGQAWLQVSDANNYASNFALLLNPNGGNVGIGTSSPSAKVHAVNSGNGFIYRFAGGTSSEITGGIFASTAAGFASIGTTSNHTFNIFTNDTDRLTVTSGGNVGIGTSSPLSITNGTVLHINGTTSGFLTMGYGGTRYLTMLAASGYAAVSTTGAVPLVFETNETERMRITSDARVLIGKTTINIDAADGFRFDENGAMFASITAGNETYYVRDITNSLYRFYVTSGGTINATNTTISAISDVRLKENITDLEIGLDAIMALRPRKFDWKKESGNDGKNVRGFIAQEFEQVFPDLIDESLNKSPEGEAYKQIRQDLIPILVKAMQQQQAQIEELKAKIK